MSKTKELTRLKSPVSDIRKLYIVRLMGRVVLLLLSVLLYVQRPELFAVLEGWSFFESFTVLHILWVIWMIDMFCQLVPIKAKISIGSQKHFRFRFQEVKDRIHYQALKEYIVSTTKRAYKVFLLWVVLIGALGVLYHLKVLGNRELFLISMLFYVCDLICVLIWCPFRLMMKNRCCTTCRIFNWDHLMMFSPMIYVLGFYSLSLVTVALAVWIMWELCVMIYPERFWEMTNEALRCTECTDKLCTQYCQKLRKNMNETL
ncbi:MAG: hypothetical protein J1E64_09855 [Acetatifactor sp.]|nr:hypothetical protein [Acetatifactor sp.]